MKDFLIWFFEQHTNIVKHQAIPDHFGANTNKVINESQKYFDSTTQGLTLKPKYFLGILDVKKEVAFLIQPGDDIKLGHQDIADAYDNDLVLVEKIGRFHKVILVLKRSLHTLIAQVRKTKSFVRFTVDFDFDRDIIVNNLPAHLVDGHIVKLEVERFSEHAVICHFVSIIGHKNDPDIDILKIVYGYDWPLEFDNDVMDEIDNIRIDTEYEKRTRVDQTEQLVVTIDGEDAKDLDDAISVAYLNHQYHVSIHIADVAYFVKEGTLLNKNAYERATSSYLADRVIPMIPHALSNDLCSLNPHTVKYTMSCDIVLSQNLQVVDYRIYPSIIESKQRLTYAQVNALIHEGITVGNPKIDEMLLIANELGQKLKVHRTQRGAIDFHSTELKFALDPKTSEVLDVEERTVEEAEGLIESFMILANEVVATHFVKNGLPGIYRIHERPDSDKLAKALETIARLGFVTEGKTVAKQLQDLTYKVANTDYDFVVNMILLRSMQKAIYSENSIGHFGLGSKHYSHFTSPIRRYPDLFLHRMIRKLVFTGPTVKDKQHFAAIVHAVAEHSSKQERKAVQMERDVAALESAKYMANKINQEFDALIISMTQAGFFIKIPCGIEGFVPIRILNTFFVYDENQVAFVNHQGTTYKLGQKIKVKLVEVDLFKREITFTIVGEAKSRKSATVPTGLNKKTKITKTKSSKGPKRKRK